MVTEMAAQFNRTPFNRRSDGRVYQETYIMAQTLRIGAGAGASIRPQYSLSTAPVSYTHLTLPTSTHV